MKNRIICVVACMMMLVGSCSKCYYENLSGKGCGDKKCSKERMIFSLS